MASVIALLSIVIFCSIGVLFIKITDSIVTIYHNHLQVEISRETAAYVYLFHWEPCSFGGDRLTNLFVRF